MDTESILQPVNETRGETKLFQRHKMSAFYLYLVLRIGDESVTIDPAEAIGSDETDDVARILVKKLEEKSKEVYEKFKVPVKMVFDETAKISFESATKCYACGQKLKGDKVRDHCHFTGRYRGALHSECNLKLRQKPFSIPVFAHNMSGYDSHMFVKLLAESEGEVSCIPQNEERYMSFSKNVLVDVINDKNVYVTLTFKDTFRFLVKSLAELVKITETFRHTDKYFTEEEQEVLRSKQHYPYEYMDSFSRFKETSIPPKEAFNSSLNSKGLIFSSRGDDEMQPEKMTDEDYEDFKKSWTASKRKTLGDFTMFYVRGNTLQMADVFENFIDVFMGLFGLDPSYYISSPHYFNDAMLKVTGAEIPLLTDPNMHLLFEDSKRGGVSLAMKRYATANNKYMKNYDSEKPSKYIQYNDKNGLYTSILAGPLPFENFTWASREYLDEIERDYEKIKPGTYRVDLGYPKEPHDAHNDYPLAVKSLTVDGARKLVPNLNDKVRYVAHHEELKLYLKHGMVLKKVHEGITYTEKAFMKKFIDICTEARKNAKNDFEKDIFKLGPNSCFGKTMENLRNHVDVEIFNDNDGSDRKKLIKRIAKPNYENSVIFEGSQLVSVRMRQSTVLLNKPIQHGVSVLSRAKVPMYEWHYEYMIPKYGDKAKLCYTDTDSLIYEIDTEDYYDDIRADVPTRFDTSAYPEDHPSGLPIMNKKVPGLMKDEACGRIITKLVCLGPKQYAYEIEDYDGMCEKEFCDGNCGKSSCVGNGDNKNKGIKKSVLKGSLTVDHYEDCLKNDATYYARFNILRSRKHDVTTETVTKVALTSADNKRIIIPNDPEHRTLAPFHWRAKDPALYNINIDTKKLFEKGSLMNLAYNAIR